MSDLSDIPFDKKLAMKNLADIVTRLMGEGRTFDRELVAEASRRCFGSYPPTGNAAEALTEFLADREEVYEKRDRGEPLPPDPVA